MLAYDKQRIVVYFMAKMISTWMARAIKNIPCASHFDQKINLTLPENLSRFQIQKEDIFVEIHKKTLYKQCASHFNRKTVPKVSTAAPQLIIQWRRWLMDWTLQNILKYSHIIQILHPLHRCSYKCVDQKEKSNSILFYERQRLFLKRTEICLKRIKYDWF